MSLTEVLQILTIISILGGGGLVAFRIGAGSRSFQAAVDAQKSISEQHQSAIGKLEREISKLAEIITAMAVANERMNQIDDRITEMRKDLTELRHGRGFIREAIQGQWPQP